jgi:hypothetical protein
MQSIILYHAKFSICVVLPHHSHVQHNLLYHASNLQSHAECKQLLVKPKEITATGLRGHLDNLAKHFCNVINVNRVFV